MSPAQPSRRESRTRQRVAATPPPVQPASAQAVQVRPSWLLGALGLLALAALCFSYLTLCLLFAQGQWQLLYQPKPQSATPTSAGLAFSPVRFGVNDAGVSELNGWWLPAATGSGAEPRLRAITVLYLHDGAGSLSESLPELQSIHALGCAVFAFDPRGYGLSTSRNSSEAHPSEAGMVEDMDRAIDYLTQTRHLAPSSIVLWGKGFGATIAAEADAGRQPAQPLVLEAINPPAVELLRADPRTRFLPVRLLLRDRLDASAALAGSYAPKLFLASAGREALPGTSAAKLYVLAAGPKELATASDTATIRRFLVNATGDAPGAVHGLQP